MPAAPYICSDKQAACSKGVGVTPAFPMQHVLIKAATFYAHLSFHAKQNQKCSFASHLHTCSNKWMCRSRSRCASSAGSTTMGMVPARRDCLLLLPSGASCHWKPAGKGNACCSSCCAIGRPCRSCSSARDSRQALSSLSALPHMQHMPVASLCSSSTGM